MIEETKTCEWCEEEKPADEISYNYDIKQQMCDDCDKGVLMCIVCDEEWTHESIGANCDSDYINEKGEYTCNDCAGHEGKCDDCDEEVGKDNLRTYNYSERNEKGYKNYYSKKLCDDCYEEYCPSID